jgi:HD superfamily phosphodiesterase
MGLKEELLRKMEDYFGADAKRINHAKKVLEFAEEIVANEGGDEDIIVATAILHDIGVHGAERKYNSSAGKYQEIEGPPIAKEILEKSSFPKEKIPEVLEIIAHHHSGGINTENFKIIWDADWLVNIPDEVGLTNKDKLTKLIEKVFLTDTGKKLARQIYL